MSVSRILSGCVLVAGLCAAPAAFAQTPSGGPQHPAQPAAGMPFCPPPFHLNGIELSEAQQDKLFQLQHQQAPAIYANNKAARKAHEALKALVSAADFSLAKARELAEAEGRAQAELALLHAQAEQQFLAMLSPEQRAALKAERDGSGPDARPPFADPVPAPMGRPARH